MSRLSLGLGVLIPLVIGPAPGRLRAQTVPPYRVGWGDGVAAAGLVGLAVTPFALGLPEGSPRCAPCDPADLPGIDRGVLGAASPVARTASDVLVFGVIGGAALAALAPGPAATRLGRGTIVGEAVAAAYAATGWLKVAVARERPVLYTDDAPAAAGDVDNRRSFPSSHTAAAFAAATSYLVVATREQLPHRGRNAALLFAGAATVGMLRVTAGQHFPTDVLGGAALGAAVGWLIPRLHP